MGRDRPMRALGWDETAILGVAMRAVCTGFGLAPWQSVAWGLGNVIHTPREKPALLKFGSLGEDNGARVTKTVLFACYGLCLLSPLLPADERPRPRRWPAGRDGATSKALDGPCERLLSLVSFCLHRTPRPRLQRHQVQQLSRCRIPLDCGAPP